MPAHQSVIVEGLKTMCLVPPISSHFLKYRPCLLKELADKVISVKQVNTTAYTCYNVWPGGNTLPIKLHHNNCIIM